MKRKPAQERRIYREISVLLFKLSQQYPRNPCDLSLLVFYANTSHPAHRHIVTAIDTLTSGPHVDCDYIEDALESVTEAKELVDELDRKLTESDRQQREQQEKQNSGGTYEGCRKADL